MPTPVPLPKTFSAIDKYFHDPDERDLRHRIKSIAITLYREQPEKGRDLCAALPELDPTDRAKLRMIDAIYCEEATEGNVPDWDLYKLDRWNL